MAGHEGRQQDQHTGKQSNGEAHSHPKDGSIDRVHGDPEKPAANSKQDEAITKAAHRTANATVAMAAFTIVLAGVSFLQWCEIRSGSEDTHKLAESMAASSRAWIMVQSTNFDVTEGGVPQGVVTVVAGGNSPAFNVTGWSCAEIRKNDPQMPGGNRVQSGTCNTIGLGTWGMGIPDSMIGSTGKPVPDDFALDPNDSGSRYYQWGEFTYQIPQDSKIHHTTFCFKNGRRGTTLSLCEPKGLGAD